jgi:hypothetical protein
MGAFLSFLFFPFLSLLAIVATFRAGRIILKALASLFDRIEDRLG